MHVLTKLFVVLVSLLVVMLVPLIVVYAYNENSFQRRYQDAEASAAASRAAFEAAQASHGAALVRKDNQLQQLEGENLTLRREVDTQSTEIRRMEGRLTKAEDMDERIQTQLSTLSNAVASGEELTTSLIDELRSLRREALTAERQKVELDEALRDSRAQLDAAVEARRALQEELQRIKDENVKALDQIGSYVAQYGALPASTAVGEMAPVDVDLNATVISVRRGPEQSLAEIDAGSRDGVREGWVMTIGQGGNFIARLRVISVDINRATGVIELEDSFGRGRVEVGQQVYARSQR